MYYAAERKVGDGIDEWVMTTSAKKIAEAGPDNVLGLETPEDVVSYLKGRDGDHPLAHYGYTWYSIRGSDSDMSIVYKNELAAEPCAHTAEEALRIGMRLVSPSPEDRKARNNYECQKHQFMVQGKILNGVNINLTTGEHRVFGIGRSLTNLSQYNEILPTLPEGFVPVSHYGQVSCIVNGTYVVSSRWSYNYDGLVCFVSYDPKQSKSFMRAANTKLRKWTAFKKSTKKELSSRASDINVIKSYFKLLARLVRLTYHDSKLGRIGIRADVVMPSKKEHLICQCVVLSQLYEDTRRLLKRGTPRVDYNNLKGQQFIDMFSEVWAAKQFVPSLKNENYEKSDELAAHISKMYRRICKAAPNTVTVFHESFLRRAIHRISPVFAQADEAFIKDLNRYTRVKIKA